MATPMIQFDLDGVEISYPEDIDGYLVEMNGEPHIYDDIEEMKFDIIKEAERRGHIIFFDVSLQANYGEMTGSKAFDTYNDAFEEYRSIDTESDEHYSWDHKQINARILH